MTCNDSVLSRSFQKAIAAQNPGMSREQRIELRNSKGHEMTFKRYHRYSGRCSNTFSVRAVSGPSSWFNHPNKWQWDVRTVFLADMLRYLDYLSLKYPQLVEMLTIGKSSLGQPLKVIKVSTGQLTKKGEAKPAVWIDGGESKRLRLVCCQASGLQSRFRISLVIRPSSFGSLYNSSSLTYLL